MEKGQKRFRITNFKNNRTELYVEDTKILDVDGLPLVLGQFGSLLEAIEFIDNKLTPTLNE